MRKLIFPIAVLILCVSGCKNSGESADAKDPEVKTPVTVTGIERSSISESIRLPATSAYLKKNQVKANVTGYIEKCLVHIGDYVQAGRPLFYIRTKEAEALSKYRPADTSFHIRGLVEIKAPESGMVTEVNKFINDYTTDGDPLATIAQQGSFVFLLNVPFELKKFAAAGTACTVVLPDSSRLNGTIQAPLSAMDPVSQTQVCEVIVSLKQNLPEYLVASVYLVKNT